MKKKLFYLVATALFALASLSATASSGSQALKDKIHGMTDTQKEERIEQIQQRLEEIKAIDKSQLTKAELKDLKNELKDMHKEAKMLRGGIYISLAGLIIIILLLILIL